MSNECHEPAPDEIRRVCLEIQAGWSDHERQGKIADPRERPRPWVVPVVSGSREVAAV